VQREGAHVNHTWTEPGDYGVHLTTTGLDSTHADDTFKVHVSGKMPTDFNPARNRRFEQK
jgi:hypothetical protein